MPDKRKTKDFPGSSHKYLEENIERNEQLLGVKSRKGEGAKGYMKRIKTNRPGSRYHNLDKKSDIMLENLLKLAGVAAPEDGDKTSGKAYADHYQSQEKANKSGTKADEATMPDAKVDLAKAGFWEGYCKIARAHGLSNLQTLGMCAVFENRQGPGSSDPYIYDALQKIAMEDAEGCDEFSALQDAEAKKQHGLASALADSKVQASLPGSPLQISSQKEKRQLEERELDMDSQYDGDGPLDTQDPKEAAFRRGFQEQLARLNKHSQYAIPVGAGLGALGGVGLTHLLGEDDLGWQDYALGGLGGGLAGAGAGALYERGMGDAGASEAPEKPAPKGPKKPSKSDKSVGEDAAKGERPKISRPKNGGKK